MADDAPSGRPMLDEATSESSLQGHPAVFQFEEAYDAVKDKPVRVQKVVIQGLERTKGEIIARELQPVQNARTLDELKDVLLEAHDALDSLDIFEGVEIVIGDSNTGQEWQPADIAWGNVLMAKGAEDTCTVLVRVKERGRFHLRTGTYVTGTEGSVEFSLGLNNVLGRAEDVSMSFELGMNNSTEVTVSVSKPRVYGWPVHTSASVVQQQRSHQEYSSYTERTRGGSLSVFSADGTHGVTYDLAWRHLFDNNHRASESVRKQLGDQLKSALSYTFRRATLDDPSYPLHGWAFRSTTEVAGIGLDSKLLRFAKQHFSALWVTPLAGSAVLCLSAEAGVMLPWGPGWAARSTCISDRFWLGGVHNNLRGFHFKGAGPIDARRPAARPADDAAADSASSDLEPDRHARDALGGDLFAALLADVRFPLPVQALSAIGMYGHAFVGGGNAALLTGPPASPEYLNRPVGARAKDALAEFGRTFRWSAGLGVVWPTRVGKLEVNMCRVLRFQPQDRFNTYGLQVGFSPSM